MYYIFFIHSSVDGHIGCFYFLAIMSSAVINVGVQMSLTDGSHFPGYIELFRECSDNIHNCFDYFRSSVEHEGRVVTWMSPAYEFGAHIKLPGLLWGALVTLPSANDPASKRWLYAQSLAQDLEKGTWTLGPLFSLSPFLFMSWLIVLRGLIGRWGVDYPLGKWIVRNGNIECIFTFY